MSVITPCRPKWAGTLTDRERFRRQMHYQAADRCFNMEFGYWKENFQEWPIFKEHGVSDNIDADVFFNFDVIKREPTLWMNPRFERTLVSETETTQVFVTQHGLHEEVSKDGHDTVPRYSRSSIQTPRDWARCKEERFRRDDPERRVDIQALQREHPKERDYPLGVHCGSMIGLIRNMLSFDGLAYAIYDYPAMVEDMVETSCVLVEDFLDQVLPHVRPPRAGAGGVRHRTSHHGGGGQDAVGPRPRRHQGLSGSVGAPG